MGVDEVRRALEIARSNDAAFFLPSVTQEQIQSAEDFLGVIFPPSYREFVTAVGCASFGAREFYGITPDGLNADSIPSVIFATIDERRHGLPPQFLLIEDPGGDEAYVIDMQDLEPNGEAPVKVWTPASDPANLEVVADDFGSYLLHAAEVTSA